MSAHKCFSRNFTKLLLIVFAPLIFVVGCNGGGGGGGNAGNGGGSGGNGASSGPPDTTAPTVTAMSPGEDTAGFGTNARLAVAFSEAMAPADITSANFRLTDDGSNFISGTISFDATNNIAVLTPPAGGLAPNTRYTATIITGIEDLANNPLIADFAWCFVTGDTADNTAPSVTSAIPSNAATGIPVNRKITAAFSEEMDSSTLTPVNFTVTGPGASRVSGTVAYVGGTAIFKPAQNLASSTTYTSTVTTGVTDLADNAMQANVTWSFTTGANTDSTAPSIIFSSPADAESNVAISSSISVGFNEPMDPITLTTANFLVTGPGGAPVIGTVSYDTSNNTATFTRINHLTTPVSFHPTPVSNLEPDTIYIATLTTGVKDMAGNAMADNLVWSFTTAP